MEMPKPSAADVERFRSLVPDDPRVETRPMFGSFGAFVNGNMFMGLLGSSIGVKLDDAGREELSAVDGAGPFGPAGSPMAAYVALPTAWDDGPDAAAWAARSLDHVAALPPMLPKAKKARKG